MATTRKRKAPSAAGPFFQKELAGETPLSVETARALCAEAAEFMRLAPWEFLEEDDLLFVTWPGVEEPYVCSVLGTLREIFAIVVYPGRAGYSFFRRAHDDPSFSIDDFLYEQNSLKLELVPRNELTRQDRELLKALGYPLHEVNPQFRTARAGYYPWYMTEAEGATLAQCSGALNSILESHNGRGLWEKEGVYPRAALHAGGRFEIDWIEPPPVLPPAEPDPIPVDAERVAVLLRKPPRPDLTIEFDVFHGMPIGKPSERKIAARIGLAVDASSGIVFHSEVAGSDTSAAGLLARMLMTTVDRVGFPARIKIARESERTALAELTKALGLKVIVSGSMPALEAAKHALLDRFLAGA